MPSTYKLGRSAFAKHLHPYFVKRCLVFTFTMKELAYLNPFSFASLNVSSDSLLPILLPENLVGTPIISKPITFPSF